MENKKLLKYLLKDLSELNEMFAEEGKTSFDEMEMEFIKNRISGAERLVKLYLKKDGVEEKNETVSIEQQKNIPPVVTPEYNKPENFSDETTQNVKFNKKEELTEESIEKIEVQASAKIQKPAEDISEKIEKKEDLVNDNSNTQKSIVEEEIEVKEQSEEIEVNKTNVEEQAVNEEVELDDEEKESTHGKRLGDSFLKEKSVNDIMSGDLSKLEHKLSNMPVSSIKASIGINDKFQYIRELFEGSADNFVKTVDELDSMENIKEAVDFLQTNFKWKKNDTSLKFVNLIKRRFPNE